MWLERMEAFRQRKFAPGKGERSKSQFVNFFAVANLPLSVNKSKFL